MKLTQTEKEQFFRVWYALIWGVNEKHKVVHRFKKPVFGDRIIQEPFIAVRNQLWENPGWIDGYLRDNGNKELSDSDCALLRSWRENFVKEQFVIVKHLKKYSVFMTIEGPAKLYGVCGISDPISVNVGNAVPLMLDTVLIPFGDKIIYDGFVETYNIIFGKNTRDSIKNVYENAKATVGIIENMNIRPKPATPPQKKPAQKKTAAPAVDTKGANVPKAMSARYMEVAGIIEAFCSEYLDSEYCEMCLRALAKLCRKRPSPLSSGKANTWACGVVYAIGSANFLFDKSQPYHMRAAVLAERFGLSKSTAGSKAGEINKMLDISVFEPEWTLPSKLGDNPMVWMFETSSGLVVDVRYAPREVQEELFLNGQIPFIYADRVKEEQPIEESAPEPAKEESPKKKAAKTPIDGQTTFFDEPPDDAD